MIEQLLFVAFVIISMINLIHFGMYLVGANYYDFLRFRSQAKAKTKKRSRALRPLVTVIIPAHNEEMGVIRSLESVRKSSYRKLEIIVVDDASTDTTRALVRAYIAAHPKSHMRLMYKQKNVGKAGAMNHALKHGAHGEFVMTLDADSLVGKKSIANAVAYFDDSTIVGVAANVQTIDGQTILGLLQKFEFIVGYRSKKFFTVTNSEFIIGGVGATYRRSTLKEVGYFDHDIITEDIALSLKIASKGNKDHRLVYGVDVLAMTESVQTFKALLKQRYRWKLGNMQSILKYRALFASTNSRYTKMFTWYRIPMAFLGEILLIFEPFVIGYVIYLCLALGSLQLLVGSYITITIYLIWNIAPDEHMSLMNKVRTSSYAPIMYFIMYIMNVVQVAAIIRCLINYKKALRIVTTHATWQSPERQKAQVSPS